MKNQICTIAAAAGFAVIAGLATTLIAQSTSATIDRAEAQARETWRVTMHQTSAPGPGCFHASYPSTRWEEVECKAPPAYRSALPKITNREQVVGNGSDYVVQAPPGLLFSSVVGSFPTVTGVTSETGVGVPLFGDGGILGPNEYTLQVNTNFFFNSAACAGFSSCFAWQQYVMSTNTPVSLTSSSLTDETEVFIEYWLIDYGVDNGSNICPSGFIDGGPDAEGPGDDCVQNTPATEIASGQLPITDLAGLTLSGSATANGTDAATVTFNGEAFTATVRDSFTDIASGWNQAEFNVFGNAGGSESELNSGSSLIANLTVTDGSTAAPSCVSGGTTGETNNLNLDSPCCPYSGTPSGIQFLESNVSGATASCGPNGVVGGNTVPSFTLSASPASVSVLQGAAADTTITISPVNGFSGAVSLSASGLPSGVSAAFSPSSATTTSTLLLSASSAATVGSATITVTGTSGSISKSVTITLTVANSTFHRVKFDFDGDGRSDLPIFRQSTGQWFIQESTTGVNNSVFGVAGQKDIPVVGDYDGDGKADRAYWDPTTGNWNVTLSSTGAVVVRQWGSSALGDIPVSGDFDGDGKTDFAVYRQSTGQWFIILSSTGGVKSAVFGVAGQKDVPVVGDFDGDGKADIAYWDPTTGNWNITLSSTGAVVVRQWGSSADGDVPVSGDFDGDGKADFAVYRQSTGQWFIILSSTGGVKSAVFGVAGQTDIPVLGDFDGDGKTDIAYWDPTTGNWNRTLSSTGAVTVTQWGAAADIDIPASAPSGYISAQF